MHRQLLQVLALLLIFSFGQVSQTLAADQPIMTLEEVERLINSSPKKEVNAYFKSVEEGTQRLTYDVILKGVYRVPGLKIIMFKTSHQIVAGMSGSPVYINSKLIGALAFSANNFNFSQYSWGGISPISLMTEEAKSGYEHSGPGRSFVYKVMKFEPIAVGNELVPGLESLGGGRFMVTTVSTGSTRFVGMANPALKAGMPIVVDLIEWTDEKGETTTVSAMGTITRVSNDGNVFAFGHSFINGRNVVYSFRTAEVMGTVYSQGGSFKLSGKTSGVLGAITFDGAYGIYGSTSLGELNKIRHFNLEFRTEGKSSRRFNIKVANSILTPLLAQAAFNMIGKANGAPLPQEASITQIETRVELERYEPIIWKELFASRTTKSGLSTIYASSYDTAYETFFSGVYDSLLNSQYGFKILDVYVSVNFIPGRDRVLKLGERKLPNKIVWGTDPVLEILFVSLDNRMAIAKKIAIKIDWSKVEKPVYKKDVLDTEKNSEKVVWGMLNIDSAEAFFNNLSENEKQNFTPEYFLGPEDFLDKFSRRLEVTNQKIFVRVGLRPKSGLFDEAVAKAESIIPEETTDDVNLGWYVMKGGLTERKNMIDKKIVVFYIDLPQIPDGYVVDQKLNESIEFEIVLEN